MVQLGDTRQSTPSVSKSLNPEWQVSFDIPILGPACGLLHAICWDKDRFGKDYMGELEILVDEIFADGEVMQEVRSQYHGRETGLTQLQPRWYKLKSKRKDSGKKSSTVSGDIQLQFSLVDTANADATAQERLQKLQSVIALSAEEEKQEEIDLAQLAKADEEGDAGGYGEAGDGDDDDDEDEDTSEEIEDPSKPETTEKRRRRLRLKRLKRKTKARAYELTGGSDVVGIIFLEIGKVTDLPPERNGESASMRCENQLTRQVTRTGFDMDPFVIASLGRKTYRTRVKRHNLNPVFDEKLVFQVLRNEQQYSIYFSVVDRDKLSGNDFVAKVEFEISTLIEAAPEADPETGLYKLPEVSEPSTPIPSKSRFRLPISRSSSSTSLKGIARPGINRGSSQASLSTQNTVPPTDYLPASISALEPSALTSVPSNTISEHGDDPPTTSLQPAPDDDPDLRSYVIPLELKNKDKWNDKHPARLYIRAKYMPYPALRQQFWRAMLKQYDADDSQRISKVELTTMLDTLGSTLKDTTIDQFFARFAPDNSDPATRELTFDQAVICLEDQLLSTPKRTLMDSAKELLTRSSTVESDSGKSDVVIPFLDLPSTTSGDRPVPANDDPTSPTIPAIESELKGVKGEQGKYLDSDLMDDRGVEHVIEIRECPICHQPRLGKRSDSDIITHIATCASQDWKQVNNLIMAGFVTSSQAQRKWYSKVVTKIGYGGYRLGANSANILVQDRMTGQINEERMSVYVRLGIRLMYKGLGSRDMEKKRSKFVLSASSDIDQDQFASCCGP